MCLNSQVHGLRTNLHYARLRCGLVLETLCLLVFGTRASVGVQRPQPAGPGIPEVTTCWASGTGRSVVGPPPRGLQRELCSLLQELKNHERQGFSWRLSWEWSLTNFQSLTFPVAPQGRWLHPGSGRCQRAGWRQLAEALFGMSRSVVTHVWVCGLEHR